ncbi:hypothetical protein T01_7167 [Trichinella spiralis]|uniref:Uncharacterized protein n=1 Tax=Trichinella spiralis TaxID=6334 RepID=A0A0V1BB67_TRISP|nr:hypothetical protein T01_7167 [Trichinella spiralis]
MRIGHCEWALEGLAGGGIRSSKMVYIYVYGVEDVQPYCAVSGKVKMKGILFIYFIHFPVDVSTVKVKCPNCSFSENFLIYKIDYVKAIEEVWILNTMCFCDC